MSKQSYARGLCKAAQQTLIYDPRFVKQIVENQIDRAEAEAKKSRSGANPRKHNTAEISAPLLHMLATGGLGGAIGYKAGKGTSVGSGMGAYLGAGAGVIAGALPHAIGVVAAYIAKRRSKREQIEADRKSTIAKWLVPGVAAYNRVKREERALLENNGQDKNAGVQGMAKQAFSWADVMSKIRAAKTWVNENPMHRALFGAGAGLAGGALLGRLVGGKSGTGTGAAIGALAGVGAGAYWNDIRKAIDAVKPVAGNAARKTKDYINRMLSGVDKGDKSDSENATEVARDAAGV